MTSLPPLPPGWLTSRPRSYWAWQLLAYVPAVLIDGLLSTVGLSETASLVDPPSPAVALSVAAVMYLPLLVRRRWPWLAFLATLAFALAATIPGVGQPFLGLLISLHAVTALRSPSMPPWALVLALVPAMTQSYWTYLTVDDHPDLIDFVIPATFFGGLTLITWGIGRHEHGARVNAHTLRLEVEQGAREAAERERRRIARELHDILSHSVSAMMMQAAGARALAQQIAGEHPEAGQLGTVEDALTTIEQTGSQSLRELHRLLSALRDPEDELPERRNGQASAPTAPGAALVGQPEHPGHADLHALVDNVGRSGLSVQLHHIGEHRSLDTSVATTAYRVVQESLTNALKHGGRGSVVDVYETWHDDSLQLQVRCRRGHDAGDTRAPGSGTGLLGLRERVELVGGTFESGWVGDEFVTTATLPLTLGAQPARSGAPGERRAR